MTEVSNEFFFFAQYNNTGSMYLKYFIFDPEYIAHLRILIITGSIRV